MLKKNSNNNNKKTKQKKICEYCTIIIPPFNNDGFCSIDLVQSSADSNRKWR